MEIIKHGEKPEDREIEWTCKNCNSVLLAKQGESRVIHDRDGMMVEFTCPVCETKGWGYP